jgi:hypothetical protein
MDGFLVVGRARIDDIPLQLCATPEEAEEFASTVNYGDVLAEAGDVFDVDISCLLFVDVVEFRGGAPAGLVRVADLSGYLGEAFEVAYGPDVRWGGYGPHHPGPGGLVVGKADGFLVVGRGYQDDLPLRLFTTRDEATEFAQTVIPKNVLAGAEDVFGVSVRGLIAVNVVEFRDGAPMAATRVRDDGDEGPLIEGEDDEGGEAFGIYG